MKEERLEVKRQARRGWGDRLLDSLHWVVAWVVIAAVCAQAAKLWLEPSYTETGIEDVRAAYVRFDDAANLASFPADERLKSVDATMAGLAASIGVSATPNLEVLARGLTYPADYLETLKTGASNEVRFAAPTGVRATAEVGGVDLVWADPAGNNVRIKEFEVLRAEGDGPETVVKTVPGDGFATRDTTAKAGVGYSYRIRAVAADAAAASGGSAKSTPSDPVLVKAIADFKIEATGLKGDALIVKVSKWSSGNWRDRIYEVRQGDAIGGKDDSLGVDFSTGRRVTQLVIVTPKAVISRQEVVFDADGRVLLDGALPRRIVVQGEETYKVATATVEGGSMPADTLIWGRR